MTRRARKLRREEIDAVLRRFTVASRPWPADMVERRDPAEYQRTSEVLFWRCVNPYCSQYTPRGSRDAGMCLICFTPRPLS